MQFPHILVINLKERTDRWEKISKQLDSLGLEYERIEAMKATPRWLGCSKSFEKCYRLAKQRKYPWVLILEDDCLIQPGGKERFEQLLPLLWQRRKEWDIFSGGSEYIHKACRVLEEPPLFQYTGWSAHFILAHMGSYNKAIRLVGGNHRADHFAKLRIRCWITYPQIAIQRNGYSNLEKSMKRKKIKHFKTVDVILKNLLSRKKRCTTKRQIQRIVNKTRKILRY